MSCVARWQDERVLKEGWREGGRGEWIDHLKIGLELEIVGDRTDLREVR